MVSSEIIRQVGTLTLQRPEKRNALNPEMVSDLIHHLHVLEKNDDVRVIRIKSAGNTFCSGADLQYLQAMQSFTMEENLEDSKQLKSLFYGLYSSQKITIAQIEGHAVAGGAGLSACCDFVFASPSSYFSFSEVRIGFVPAMVMVFLQNKVGKSKTRDLLLSGRKITAKEALDLQWLNDVFPEETMEAEVLKFADNMIKQTSPQAISQTKDMLNRLDHLSTIDFLEEASKRNAMARSTEDCKKGIDAFLNKKPLQWNG